MKEDTDRPIQGPTKGEKVKHSMQEPILPGIQGLRQILPPVMGSVELLHKLLRARELQLPAMELSGGRPTSLPTGPGRVLQQDRIIPRHASQRLLKDRLQPALRKIVLQPQGDRTLRQWKEQVRVL